MGSKKCALLLIGVLLIFLADITLPAQGRSRELGETFRAGKPRKLSVSAASDDKYPPWYNSQAPVADPNYVPELQDGSS
ncbi:hypothetical protein FH972_000803 [Carpinus fangiana]|uniref:Uncharacterized protein n=1 Tax=Carpinus fangiana TaxID=176857 RepID=A0A5N6QCG3_9ROSI|nr:hypothetical protein FH972_000803 [Carpinus fangiana]